MRKMQRLYQYLDNLTDLEFDIELILKEIEALTCDEPNLYHISDDTECVCFSCLGYYLEEWQKLIKIQNMIKEEINHILGDS